MTHCRDVHPKSFEITQTNQINPLVFTNVSRSLWGPWMFVDNYIVIQIAEEMNQSGPKPTIASLQLQPINWGLTERHRISWIHLHWLLLILCWIRVILFSVPLNLFSLCTDTGLPDTHTLHCADPRTKEHPDAIQRTCRDIYIYIGDAHTHTQYINTRVQFLVTVDSSCVCTPDFPLVYLHCGQLNGSGLIPLNSFFFTFFVYLHLCCIILEILKTGNRTNDTFHINVANTVPTALVQVAKSDGSQIVCE